jgi:hypothetical protein
MVQKHRSDKESKPESKRKGLQFAAEEVKEV